MHLRLFSFFIFLSLHILIYTGDNQSNPRPACVTPERRQIQMPQLGYVSRPGVVTPTINLSTDPGWQGPAILGTSQRNFQRRGNTTRLRLRPRVLFP